ncbi:type II toxin-antitoxin system MqsA family antitoxin [Pseudomonas anuradhapurensis]|uniref:type II toxin-antitoxin system MqsA family antitoxin n=1 Tax=Pseudomonas anuradhapurensis TaxID=485870 RepID=UPI0016454553|nr:type II toxin-antitoxin system MqsA family antitoxin [Pseudomonas anuradhapurensis]QXI49185.1 type II toxin-antitoxin system MqsA family antitoxin [Pseudomonas anuradhapurensis]
MNTQIETCPLCGEGCLHEVSRDRAVEHKGVLGHVRTKAFKCNACGCSQASPSQVRDNQRAMTAFQKMAEGRLTGQQMRDARIKLDLTQSQASLIFGGGPNSFAKYEADDVTQSEAMDNLVRLALEVPAARDWLYSKAAINNSNVLTDHIWAQQVYHFNLAHQIARHALSKHYSMMSNERFFGSQRVKSSLRTLHEQIIEEKSVQVNWSGLADVLDSKVRLYGEEENIQSFFSPTYSEEDYDRHTQR